MCCTLHSFLTIYCTRFRTCTNRGISLSTRAYKKPSCHYESQKNFPTIGACPRSVAITADKYMFTCGMPCPSCCFSCAAIDLGLAPASRHLPTPAGSSPCRARMPSAPPRVPSDMPGGGSFVQSLLPLLSVISLSGELSSLLPAARGVRSRLSAPSSDSAGCANAVCLPC